MITGRAEKEPSRPSTIKEPITIHQTLCNSHVLMCAIEAHIEHIKAKLFGCTPSPTSCENIKNNQEPPVEQLASDLLTRLETLVTRIDMFQHKI